ncbi:alpha-L-fucosidase [Pedobacter sp. MW01-1-1]|uniref:alpha-L-fucosidase n=1 Tax=Pedobacter sp. MW01-1-1 TaxID=3383027 RepID=UPI003FF0AD9B
MVRIVKRFNSVLCLLFMLLLQSNFSFAQVHEMDNNYVEPTDPQVKENLKQWQDLKFGLFMHWGTYSQWGVVESWSICPEDENWIRRKPGYENDYFGYKKAYENLQTTFNPVNFNPEKWAKAAKDAGMRYMVFTTKHHDGFSMFDTKQTDYKITDSKTPFSSNPRSNLTKEIFNVFRKDNFKIGAYFSKPDWHNENYWWPEFPPKDRNPNYNPAKHPERWERFKDFTYKQIEELMSDYGKVDILWLDGGQVRPVKNNKGINEKQSGLFNQDIDMPKIAAMAREHQPGLIVVDRTVSGPYENYKTPEQQLPDAPLPYPWETCMTMGKSWSYVPNDTYKSSLSLIQTLVKIVSRGGNFLLNIGPGPTGDWDPVAYERLKDIGAWMKINGQGIYGSQAIAPYSKENQYYTQSVAENKRYVFYLSEKESVHLPAEITMELNGIKKVKKVSLLGVNKSLSWKLVSNNLVISIPKELQSEGILKYAATFKVEY